MTSSLMVLLLFGYIQETFQIDCLGNMASQLTKAKDDRVKTSENSDWLTSVHANPIISEMHSEGYLGYHFLKVFTLSSKKFLISRSQVGNFFAAAQACYIYGGHMAEMENEAEYTGVVDVLKTVAYPFYCIWVGAEDMMVEGEYKFYDSKKPAYTKFASGSANGNRTTNCVVVYPNQTPSWTMGYIQCRPNFFCHYLCQLQ